jgi:hypothetical protein
MWCLDLLHFPQNVFIFSACFHLGVHDHPIAKGECRETMKVVKNLIANEVKQSPNACQKLRYSIGDKQGVLIATPSHKAQ